jgi:flagellar FliJ protein
MARFVFKLEPLLKQRKREEQEKQRELASRELVVVNLKNELTRLDESLKSASEDLRKNHLTGAIDLNFLAAHRRFLGAMQRQGMLLVQKIATAQAHVDDARRKLAEAAKQRKVIERLREKQFARWQEDQARRELAAMDEIGSQIGYANVTEDLARSEMLGGEG